MDEKESKKINLSTVLLIIAIIIIIALCIYIFVLSNKNTPQVENINNSSSSASPENNISNTVLENDIVETKEKNTSSTSTDTLPQLAGEFFEIKSIIKDSRDTQNIKNYKDFEYDLDSDGTIDKITLKHIVNEDESEFSSDRDYYAVEYKGKSIYDHWWGLGSVGIVDLDNTDKFLEVWVYDNGPSDDPVYSFYRKVGNQIIKMGEFDIDLAFYCDGKGKILSADRDMPWVTPQVFTCYYSIENNTFKKHSLDFSYNKDYEYTSKNGFFTTDLENLKNFEKEVSEHNEESNDRISIGKKHNINKLSEDTKFKIIDFLEKENENSLIDLKIELADGTKGYLIHPYSRFDIFD